jgi:tRNA G18 (ribose-2'-O)-methylase SpoU
MRKLGNDELGRMSPEEAKNAERTPVVFILENVRSMNNVGSVFRTADAFLLHSVLLCGYTPVPPHREIQKTALGATETVTWKHFDSASEAIAGLRASGAVIYAVEQAEQSLVPTQVKMEPGRLTAFIFGNEVEGVKQETIDQCDGVVEIPQFGMKHSLNIAVSAGIIGWEMVREK